MEKKLTKNEKGITLVALIITIIILLILAVISIRAITGDNILGKAETGKNKYLDAKEQEEEKIKNYVEFIDDNSNETSEEEYIRQLLIKANNGDEKAQTELVNLGNFAIYMRMDSPELVYIVETKNNKTYMYFMNDNDPSNVEVLDKNKEFIDEDGNKQKYYDSATKFYSDYKNIQQLFVGKKLEDFEQTKISDSEWKFSNLSGVFSNEITVNYQEEGEISFIYDENLSLKKFTLKNSNGFKIENDKITGTVESVGMDD